MIIWGGSDGVYGLNTGGRYNPAADVWVSTTGASAPPGRAAHNSVWTGLEMLIFGGNSGLVYDLNDTYNYTPPTTMYLYLRP
jgi:hypothetical protein